MARTLKGNLTGTAARTERREVVASALEDLIPLTHLDRLEIKLNVARKMHASSRKNGFRREARKYYMQAYRLQKRIAALKESEQ